MRNLLPIVCLLSLLCTGAAADNIVPSPASAEAGESISVSYTNLPEGASLLLYKDDALLPLRTSYTVENTGNGSFSTESTLEPGRYQIRCEQEGVASDYATFYIADYPLQRKKRNLCLLTDIHVMHPDLVANPGSAYNNLLASDRKMLAQSADALKALTDSVLLYRPDLLLIAGDLTKDGERISHELVAEHLRRLKEAGIPSLVVPGNHDIKNPNARYYDGSQTRPAEDILADDFAAIYHDYGYGENTAQDSNSLSYIAEPLPGLCILGIDATRWYDNQSQQHGDATNQAIGDGQLREETLQWILAQADQAQADGKTVIAMMHHQLLQHFNMQARLVPSTAIAQGDSISRLFMQHGIRLILTGHMHTSDITTYYNETLTDSIVEITTGSAIAYPSPYRWLSVSEKGDEVEVNTRYIKALDTISDFGLYGREELRRHIPQMTRSVTNTLLNLIDEIRNSGSSNNSPLGDLFSWLPADRTQTAAMVYEYLGEPFTLALLTHNESNEHLKQTDNIISLTETGMEQMLDKMMEEHYGPIERKIRIRAICALVKAPMNLLLHSLLNDITYYGTRYANQTDDLYARLRLPAQSIVAGQTAPDACTVEEGNWYDLLGRQLATPPTQSGFYLHGHRKVYIP